MKELGMATVITAHAGAENTKANSLESIRALTQCGSDAIEVDVRMKDGVLYMNHDPLVPGEHYDTLEECFRLVSVAGQQIINIDLKEEGLIQKVHELALKYDMGERYLYTGSVSDAETPYLREHGLTAWYNCDLISKDWAADPVRGVEAKGFAVLNTWYGVVTDEMVERDAKKLSIWTVKEEEMMVRFLKAGVRNITTRSPLLALRLRKEIQGC